MKVASLTRDLLSWLLDDFSSYFSNLSSSVAVFKPFYCIKLLAAVFINANLQSVRLRILATKVLYLSIPFHPYLRV